MKNKAVAMDILVIVFCAIFFCFLCIAGLNWDHVELWDGMGRDDDGFMASALGYVENFQENWKVSYKYYPQGYPLVLAGFYKAYLFFSKMFNVVPSYEIIDESVMFANMPNSLAKVNTAEGRTFFTLAARLLSVLFGFLSVLLCYFMGKNFYQSRRIGVFGAFLLMSMYPFIMLCQVRRYPTAAIFFFSLAIYSGLKVVRWPSVRNYILFGLWAGLAMSMMYTTGTLIVVLLCAQAYHVFFNKNREISRRVLFLRFILSILVCGVVFFAMNPRLFVYFKEWLLHNYGILGLFGGSPKMEFLLYRRYEGLFSVFLNLHQEVGFALLWALLGGWVYSVFNFREKGNFIISVIGLFYLLSFNVMSQSYYIALIYPILLVMFARCFVEWMNSRGQLSEKTKDLIFVLGVVIFVSPGMLRTFSLQLINKEQSTFLKARLWIDQHIPEGTRFILDLDGVRLNDDKYDFSEIVRSGGERGAARYIVDLLINGQRDLFDAQYAVVGSPFYSEIISDENIRKYSALREILSPGGRAYGLKQSHERYSTLLEKNAELLKRFPAGEWIAEDHINPLGYRYYGLPVKKMSRFFLDQAFRMHGPEVRIYKLTDNFWKELIAEMDLGKSYSCLLDSSENPIWAEGRPEELLSKEIFYDKQKLRMRIRLTWRSDCKNILRTTTYFLEHSSRQNRGLSYYIKKIFNVFKGRDNKVQIAFNEFFHLNQKFFVKEYSIQIPSNLDQGEYVLRMNYSGSQSPDYELAVINIE